MWSYPSVSTRNVGQISLAILGAGVIGLAVVGLVYLCSDTDPPREDMSTHSAKSGLTCVDEVDDEIFRRRGPRRNTQVAPTQHVYDSEPDDDHPSTNTSSQQCSHDVDTNVPKISISRRGGNKKKTEMASLILEHHALLSGKVDSLAARITTLEKAVESIHTLCLHISKSLPSYTTRPTSTVLQSYPRTW